MTDREDLPMGQKPRPLRSGHYYFPESLLRRLWFCPPTTMPTGCIEFTGSIDVAGYGRIHKDGRPQRPHRVAYELVNGPIPDGMQLDHLCRNRACVNPGHLEPVSCRENLMRGEGPSALNAVKTQCAHGHTFDPDNTYYAPNGHRGCRQCRKEADRRYRSKLR